MTIERTVNPVTNGVSFNSLLSDEQGRKVQTMRERRRARTSAPPPALGQVPMATSVAFGRRKGGAALPTGRRPQVFVGGQGNSLRGPATSQGGC